MCFTVLRIIQPAVRVNLTPTHVSPRIDRRCCRSSEGNNNNDNTNNLICHLLHCRAFKSTIQDIKKYKNYQVVPCMRKPEIHTTLNKAKAQKHSSNNNFLGEVGRWRNRRRGGPRIIPALILVASIKSHGPSRFRPVHYSLMMASPMIQSSK